MNRQIDPNEIVTYRMVKMGNIGTLKAYSQQASAAVLVSALTLAMILRMGLRAIFEHQHQRHSV